MKPPRTVGGNVNCYSSYRKQGDFLNIKNGRAFLFTSLTAESGPKFFLYSLRGVRSVGLDQ